MRRSTRLLVHTNSPESYRFALPSLRWIPNPRNFATISSTLSNRTTPSIFQSRLFTSQNIPIPLRKAPHFPPAMETAGNPLPESDTSIPEDFVHVQNPDPLEIYVDEANQNPNPNPTAANDLEASRSDDFNAVGDSEGCEAKRVLPEELPKGVVFLECESTAEGGACGIYLVGTAHISQESCKEVQAVIRYLKPQVVFLELCSNRVAILTPQNLQVPTMGEMMDMWRKKKMNIFGILYSWFLAKVADKLEVLPGSEFRVAFEEAMSYGAKVILGDRPVQITLRRTWGKMTLWHKAKFLYYILFQTIFLPSPEDLNKMLKEMDDVDMLTLVIQEMSKAFPTLMETLLYERDLYMSSTLLKVASEHSSVVAVVGKGHLPGIKKHWKQPVEVKGLLEIPAANSGVSAMKILASVGIVVTGAAIISGIYLSGKR